MEILIFIALIVIFILVLNIQSTQKNNQTISKKSFNAIYSEIQILKEKLAFNTSNTPTPNIDEEKSRKEKEAAEIIAQEEYKQKIASIEKLRQEREANKLAETERQLQQTLQPQSEINTTPSIQNQYTQTSEPFVEKESWSEKWIKNNPDIEKFIGENLFNKIGIAVLVFGIGFFVKYAIDQDWIGEYGRVAIGITCGAILVGLAHYLRNTYRSFSSVLAGGGITVFYFTIAFAFHQYHIIGQATSFITMVIITAFAVALAILYNKLELAVIATIGGFLTPFLVFTGAGNYIVLFTYLIILNIGLLALSYFKKWPLINILSLFFTIIIYGSWVIKTFVFTSSPLHHANGLLFGTIFYLVFLAMNMIYNIVQQKVFKAFDFFILIFINATYFAAGMEILAQWNDGAYKGLFTMLLSVINFALAFYFYKTQKADKNFLYLLIGLTLTFLSLAAPIQMQGQNITLFWSAEAVLLYWLFQRSQIGLFKTSSMLVLLLMLISLMMDWYNAGENNEYGNLPIIFTGIKGIVTNVVAIASLITYYFLVKNDELVYISGISNRAVSFILIGIAGVLIYLTFFFGINLHYAQTKTYVFANVYHRLMTNSFALAASLFVLPKILKEKSVYVNLALLVICFLIYMPSVGLISNLRAGILAKEFRYLHMLSHWVGIIVMLALVYNSINLIRKNIELLGTKIKFIGWVLSFIVVFVLSFELKQVYIILLANSNNEHTYISQFNKAGLTILWSLCSFIMIWLGFKHSYKPLRVIAIVLFAIALLKLFVFDIRNISPGGKIAAFIMLGILLLSISFMYQRLKKILIDDEKK